MNNSVILDLQQFQRGYVHLLTEDISDEKMAVQPGGIVNHPAWHLGHLSWALDLFIQAIGGKTNLDSAWLQRYARDTLPTSDRSAYASKAELLNVLDERRAEFARLFKNVNADELAKPPANPKVAQRFPTMGLFLLFGATTHEASHLGQIAVWRHAMGMTQALSKAER